MTPRGDDKRPSSKTFLVVKIITLLVGSPAMSILALHMFSPLSVRKKGHVRSILVASSGVGGMINLFQAYMLGLICDWVGIIMSNSCLNPSPSSSLTLSTCCEYTALGLRAAVSPNGSSLGDLGRLGDHFYINGLLFLSKSSFHFYFDSKSAF